MYLYVFEGCVGGRACITSYDGRDVIAVYELWNLTECEFERLEGMTSEDLRNYLRHNM